MEPGRIYSLLVSLAALVAVAPVVTSRRQTASSQSAATVIAIANMEFGSAPAGFDFARTGQGGPGKWTVVNDETSFAGRVIEQSSTDRTDYRFPLAILDPVVAKNVDVSVKFKPVAGHVDQAGALPFVFSMATTTTSSVLMRLKTTFVLPRRSKAVESRLTA